MVDLKALENSTLYKRIADPSLKAIVAEAAPKAAALLGTVVQDMPLYTLHNERHILNVIGWMESLLGREGIEKLSELECAVSILAAYAHDLGMTLTPEERANIPTDAAYGRYRDGFSEETSFINRLRSQGDHYRAALIENYIITDYIRATHAGQPEGRMAARLHEVAPQFVFARVDLIFHLELLALSHNWPVEWLRLEFERRRLFWHTSINGQRINFPFLGILLRLADILDFDSSRSPTILFRHLGLDKPLAARLSDISAGEWKKHLAITDTTVSADGSTVTYRADACPDPITHKSILHFIGIIEDELRRCTLELRQAVDALSDDRYRLAIRLSKVEQPSITPAIDRSGNHAYEYRDWSFRLDQEEIIRLLMGETLYGDPNLCIRELLQNSLDALELRDHRLQLKDKRGRPFQPIDSLEQELAVTLSWGEQDGIQFLRVDDNGTGMTLQTIERYFTQIGKSFYKSPDFSAEQAEFRRHGLISTPISQFGIGILSCFMIADRLSVRTNPGGNQPAADLEISGPGSLFWTRPGTRESQGTEITLWLRSTHRLPMDHDREDVFTWLRGVFDYPGGTKPTDDQVRDPGFIAAGHVIWPKYPVHIAPPRLPRWTINDRFHIEHLAPIDPKKFSDMLAEWNYPVRAGNEPSWEVYDWEDVYRSDASGTRLRIWHPVQPTPELEWWEVHTFVEPQVQQKRPVLLAQGMFVSDVNRILECLPCGTQAGCRVWIDLRGRVAPSLTADRKTARPQRVDAAMAAWESLVLRSERAPALVRRMNWRRSLHIRVWDGQARPPAGRLIHSTSEARWRLAASALLTSLALDRYHDVDHDLARALQLARVVAHIGDRALDRTLGVVDGSHGPDRAHAFDRALALDLAHDLAFTLNLAVFNDDLGRARFLPRASDESAEVAISTSFLQEAFFPDLTRSWPPLGLQALDGKIGDAILTAPAAFGFELDGRRVLFGDQSGTLPPKLSRRGYDLCFPMSAIPLGRLRREFPKWRENRRYRPLGILPFLLPDLAAVWPKHAEELLATFAPIRSMYALQPAESLWYKSFADWTPADWQHPDHKSVFWSIGTGAVVTYPGVRDRPAE